MFSSSFDSAFRTIPFYKNHEFMLPAVGVNYESTKHKKLLLVGESCYMPKASFVHHNVNLWYDNYLCLGEKLTDSEKNAAIYVVRVVIQEINTGKKLITQLKKFSQTHLVMLLRRLLVIIISCDRLIMAIEKPLGVQKWIAENQYIHFVGSLKY